MAQDRDARELYVAFKAGRVPKSGIYAAVHAFGDARLMEAKTDVEGLLSSPDAQLRYIALNVLAIHWRCPEHRVTCERFLLTDPDDDNRRLGASGLGALLGATRDVTALRTLLGVLRNSEEAMTVRGGAYFAILDILGIQPTAERLLRLPFAMERVDTVLLAEAERLAN